MIIIKKISLGNNKWFVIAQINGVEVHREVQL